MAKVTGLGGVFLRARDPKRLTAWYAEHLGLPVTEWGGVTFVWDECAAPEGHGTARRGRCFLRIRAYFGEGEQSVMLNFRVMILTRCWRNWPRRMSGSTRSSRTRSMGALPGSRMVRETASSYGSRDRVHYQRVRTALALRMRWSAVIRMAPWTSAVAPMMRSAGSGDSWRGGGL